MFQQDSVPTERPSSPIFKPYLRTASRGSAWREPEWREWREAPRDPADPTGCLGQEPLSLQLTEDEASWLCLLLHHCSRTTGLEKTPKSPF